MERLSSSVFRTTRLALPGMRAKPWGRIGNIASVHGLVASKKSAYVAKHGVVGPTRPSRWKPRRWKSPRNALCPGWVLTPLVNGRSISVLPKARSWEAARDALLATESSHRANSLLQAVRGSRVDSYVQTNCGASAWRSVEYGWRLGWRIITSSGAG